jgi:hypothetical protein
MKRPILFSESSMIKKENACGRMYMNVNELFSSLTEKKTRKNSGEVI